MARKLLPYDPIIALLRSHLLANDELVNWDKWKDGEPLIYPRYLEEPDNATYPCITIYRDYGIRLKNKTGHDEGHYFIHGWLKAYDEDDSSAVDDVAYFMNMVLSTLSDDRVLGRQVTEVDMCRCVDSRCPCYEAQSRTYFFMTDWRIIYDSMMMFEFD